MKFPGNLYGQGGKAVPRTVEEDLRIQVADLTAKLERLTQEKDEQCKAKEVFFNGMNDIREQREALRREVAELTRQLDAQHAEIRDMRKSIDTAAKGIVRLTTERDDLTAKLKAKDSALEFAKAAIGDAIYLEEGLDGETGQRVQRLIVEALERGTCDAPGDIADFLTTRERVTQDQITDLTRRLEEAQEDARRVRIERDNTYENLLDIQAKLAAAEQERDTMRTALLALPVVEGEIFIEKVFTCNHWEVRLRGEGSSIGLGYFYWEDHANHYAALLRLAQAMR